jgi:hypothetical protein
VERPALTRRLALAFGAALLLVVIALLVRWLASPSAGPLLGGGAPERLVPEGTRVRIEVLNATSTRGLARRATLYLRDRGFDVVAMGNSAEKRDSTLILDRAGNAEFARLAAEAMGGARIESRPDTSRYLDVTVLVGASWRPPSQPLYP